MLPEWTVVGFSGHRKLAHPEAAARGIAEAIRRLTADRQPLAAVSSAASGADTLFVEAVAKARWPHLVILPFPKARFQQDFTPADWQRVEPLIDQATHVEVVAQEESPEQAYMEAGIQVADKADVMVVVWDGNKSAGLGGTGDVVEYARERKKPLFIINPETGNIEEERTGDLPKKFPPKGWDTDPRATVKKHFTDLDAVSEANAPTSRHLVLRIILFQIVASAIGLTALTFEDHEKHSLVHPLTTFAELVLLGIAFVLSLQHRKKHHEWMKSRISAEICRSFLATWDLRRRGEHSPRISVPGYAGLCRNLRLTRLLDPAPAPALETARDVYLKERLQDQLDYFSRKSKEALTVQKTLKGIAVFSTATATVLALVALTLLAVRDLALAGVPNAVITIPKYLSLLLPLASAAIFSLLITQDYSRRAVRYGQMAGMLEEAVRRLKTVRTWNTLAKIANETEEELLQEIVEWHSFRQFTGEPHSH